MSYEIIKGIKIDEKKGEVWLDCACNNVYPRTFSKWLCKSLSTILKEQGREQVEFEILKDYENGNIQRGNNKFTRALKVLKHFPEYKEFDWRIGSGVEYQIREQKRKGEEFKALLLRALKTQLPRDKFVIAKQYGGRVAYIRKITKAHAFWGYEKAKAKVFRYLDEIEQVKRGFTNSGNWTAEQVA